MTLENLTIIVSAVAIIIGLVGVCFSVMCSGKYKKQRLLLESTGKQLEELKESQSKTSELFENNRQRISEQARRIAWLESRVLQPKPVKQEKVVDEVVAAAPLKVNITERRHRVLSLSSRGQSAEVIASTLGMMPGEVDLIVKLNQANLAAN